MRTSIGLVRRSTKGSGRTRDSGSIRWTSPVAERVFDHYLPPELRLHSESYWTPLAVIRRAGRWLDGLGVRTVLDIGSGSGKFCVAGALASRCTFTGIEHRPRLVNAARSLARLFQVEDRVRFIEAALGDQPLPAADAYYFYNPFGENLVARVEHLDQDVEVGFERYLRDLQRAKELIAGAPVGTVVLTYHGLGCSIPSSYREMCPDPGSRGLLRMWRRVTSGRVRVTTARGTWTVPR